MESEESRFTSASLIVGVQGNQEDAWTRLTIQFGPLVFKWITNLGRGNLQPSDVADISQEVFLTATQKIETYQHDPEKHGSFRGWLYGITRNKVLKHFDIQRKTPAPVDDATLSGKWNSQSPTLNDGADSEDSSYVLNVKEGQTHKAIEIVRSKTERQTWEAFWRTVVNGEDNSHVAEDLNKNGKAVRQARHRVINMLRDEVQRLEESNRSEE